MCVGEGEISVVVQKGPYHAKKCISRPSITCKTFCKDSAVKAQDKHKMHAGPVGLNVSTSHNRIHTQEWVTEQVVYNRIRFDANTVLHKPLSEDRNVAVLHRLIIIYNAD